MPAAQPTLKDIAQRVGVSVFTVSRVLNGKHKGEWASKARQADHIKAVAAELGYRPNQAARAMQRQRSRLVGVLQWNPIHGGPSHPAMASYLQGIDEVLTAAGHGTVLVDLRADHEPLAMRERLLDGAIVVSQITPEAQRAMLERFGHVVWVDSPAPEGASAVLRDEAAGIDQVVALLQDRRDLRRIRYLGNAAAADSHYSVAARWDALEAARDRLPAPLERVEGVRVDRRRATFERVCAELEPGDCWLAYDAYTLEALFHHAVGCGVCPGRDVALLGCDGYATYPQQWPQLTCLLPDTRELGRRAARRLLAELDGATAGAVDALAPRLQVGTSHLCRHPDGP